MGDLPPHTHHPHPARALEESIWPSCPLWSKIVTMKTINVARLKAQLSACLRLVRSGERYVVLDRNEPVAQLGPLDATPGTGWETLARAGLVRLGSQEWSGLRIKPLRRRVPAQRLLAAVRDDA